MPIRQPIELVTFDLGGTLIYDQGPWEDLFLGADKELWNVLHAAGVPFGPREVYGDSSTLFDLYYKLHRNDLNEPTSAGVLDRILRDKGFRIDRETLRAAMRAMFSVTQTNWLPEEDALETLGQLHRHGYHIGLISNASDDDNTQALIDKAKLRPYLEYIVSSASFGRRKPDASIFQAALRHFGVAPARAVMVGDNYEADIVGGAGVGLQTIWLTRRAGVVHPEAMRPGANAIAQTLREVAMLLDAARKP